MKSIDRFLNSTANTIWGLFAKRPSAEQLKSVKIVAHRGIHENALAKENTRAAFQLAIDNQIWGMEFDVRWTADNVPVIIHDVDCGRVHNCPRVIANSTFAELRTDVPDLMSLEEVIQAFSQKIVLLIELKESLRTHPARVDKLEKILGRLIPRKHFYLLALDPQILESVGFVSKKAMMDVGLREVPVKTALNLGHGAVSGPFVLLSSAALKTCKENGILTGTGFIESRGAFYREVGRGIDMIFTNTPIKLKSYL